MSLSYTAPLIWRHFVSCLNHGVPSSSKKNGTMTSPSLHLGWHGCEDQRVIPSFLARVCSATRCRKRKTMKTDKAPDAT